MHPRLPGLLSCAAAWVAAGCSAAEPRPGPVCFECGGAGSPLQRLRSDGEGSGDAGGPRCCAPRCATGGAGEVTHGPLLGAVSEASVKVWARSLGGAELAVVHWPSDAPAEPRLTRVPAPSAETDHTGVVTLQGLAADTEYDYRLLLWSEAPCAAAPLARQRFRTLGPPDTPGPLRFGFGADIAFDRLPVFDEVAAHEPAFMLLVGDNMYADDVPHTRAGYESQYRATWAVPELRAFMAHVPVFMMWDDHEIVDDFWPGRTDSFEAAALAYGEYQHSHNPAPYRPGVRYYSLRAQGVGFFVLDVRSHRSPSTAPDGAGKSMLGLQQKQDLLDWLANSPDPIKAIVSPVPFHDHGITGPDSWRGYTAERGEIFDFIRVQGVTGVLLISGDQHWSGVFRLATSAPDQVLYELMPTPIAIENFAAPAEPAPQFLARDDDHRVYGIFDVDAAAAPPRLTFTMCRQGAPCDPGAEPPPGTPLDRPPEMDNLPYGIELELRDGRLELVDPARYPHDG